MNPPFEPPRDRYKRPLVVPPNGGPEIAYTRCTTYVSGIEDGTLLAKWKQRMTATGLAERDDLRLAVAAHKHDKRKLDELCEDALEAAKGTAAATTGTALHAFSEQVDRGLDPVVPAPYLPDLDAYRAATAMLRPVYIEQFTVLDQYKIGGTPDRVVDYQGDRYIADLKTGSIDWGYLKIAAQLAVYSRAAVYDATGNRTPHGASTERGIIIHLPAGTGTCTLYWIDLLAGWRAVLVCRDIREQRARPMRQIVTPFDDDDPQLPIAPVPVAPPSLEEQIRAAADRATVTSLWKTHAAEWTEELTTIAKTHIATLA